MVESSLRAASVASHTAGGFRQLSQFPQGVDCSPKYASSRTRRQSVASASASSASSLPRSACLNSSPAGLSSIMRRWLTTSFRPYAIQVLLTHFRVQTRVVGQGSDARVAQRGGQLFHALARLAIHHARLARMLALDEAQQLRGGVLFLFEAVADVGPVKAADEQPRILQLQPLDDVLARERIGRGGERNARYLRVTLVQQRERAVFGAEIVAPLADAVCFVDGEQAQVAAAVQAVEQAQETGRVQPLGRGIQQREVAGLQA